MRREKHKSQWLKQRAAEFSPGKAFMPNKKVQRSVPLVQIGVIHRKLKAASYGFSVA
jgi:hypothetical protein